MEFKGPRIRSSDVWREEKVDIWVEEEKERTCPAFDFLKNLLLFSYSCPTFFLIALPYPVSAHCHSQYPHCLGPWVLYSCYFACPLKLALACVAQLVGTLSSKLRGCGFNSQSGHMLSLWVRSLVGEPTGGNQIDVSVTSIFRSLFIPLLLSKINEKKKSSSEDKKREINFIGFSYFAFFFHLGPQQIGWCPFKWVKEEPFIQGTKSNANLFQKYPHRHTQKYVLPAMWTSLSPVKLTHKINHTIYPYELDAQVY